MKPYKAILIGLVLSCLQACSTPSPPPQLPQAKPDPAWLEPVPEPQLQGRTNGDLAQWAKSLREALAEANANLAAVKQWADGL